MQKCVCDRPAWPEQAASFSTLQQHDLGEIGVRWFRLTVQAQRVFLGDWGAGGTIVFFSPTCQHTAKDPEDLNAEACLASKSLFFEKF